MNMQWLDMYVKGLLEKVYQRGSDLIKFLKCGLKDKVYEKSEVEYIEISRTILDMQSWVLLPQDSSFTPLRPLPPLLVTPQGPPSQHIHHFVQTQSTTLNCHPTNPFFQIPRPTIPSSPCTTLHVPRLVAPTPHDPVP